MAGLQLRIKGGASALLDTSVWVRYLRPKGSKLLKEEVREALRERMVSTCWPVKAELLVGSPDDVSFERLRTMLEATWQLPVTDANWFAASQVGYRLRRQGLTVPLPDLLIAEVARARDQVVWHIDGHFEHIARILPLKVRRLQER